MANIANAGVEREKLERLVRRLPPGRARHRYESMLTKFSSPLGGVLCNNSLSHEITAIKTGTEAGQPGQLERLSSVEDGAIQAIKIYSQILEDEIWLILDRQFVPTDGVAVYYLEEINVLRTKTVQDLREIHKVKLVFPGCRVVQDA